MDKQNAKETVDRIHGMVEQSVEQTNGLADAVYLVSLCMRDGDPLCSMGVPALEAIADSIKDIQEKMLTSFSEG